MPENSPPPYESIGERVLLEEIGAADERSGILIPEEAKRRVTGFAIVVSSPESARVAPGDIVVFRKYAAEFFDRANSDGTSTRYASVREPDLICRVLDRADLVNLDVSAFSIEGINVRASSLAQDNRAAMIEKQKEKARQWIEERQRAMLASSSQQFPTP